MGKYDIEVIRHSTAHLMAQAIQELYPTETVMLGIGPVIEHGFYYDIDMERKISDNELEDIEKKMHELIDADLEIVRKEVSREEAIEIFTKQNQLLKVELIKEIPDSDTISYYTQGGEDRFLDLCRGPHVESTKKLPKHFKLLHTAGAYWRGDEKNKMLQRIYAVCFDDRKKLKAHLNFLEEAKKRDHRKLGKELELFHFETCTPGNPFFHPKGAFLFNGLIEFARRIISRYGYQEVLTPLVMDVELWHTSGHYDNYKENMYFSVIDDREYAVKPMNCPGHMLLFKHGQKSYRDLPLRLAEFGKVHRYEKSGVMAGLTRVRSFVQDDAHIYLREDQIVPEILSLIDMFVNTYKHIGFENIVINLSTRPDEKRIGSDEVWDMAEGALKDALAKSGIEFKIKEGDGAFYGPKIDFDVSDAIGRYFQLGTIQLDFLMPERFDLNYTNENDEKVRPVVIHRALLGSIERFLGIFIEHTAGAFPFWIAPEQAVIVPVSNDVHLEYAKEIQTEFMRKGFRVRIDDRNESMGFKTRQIQKSKVPFMMVIGDKEIENKALSLRKYGEKHTKTLSNEEVFELFKTLDEEKIPKQYR